MRCLLIDNYDSFTYNLADYIGQQFGESPVVVLNDQYSWDELKDREKFDCIIVSPGPGNVLNEKDFHISRDAILQNELPVLGVCLGFQGLAHCYGGKISHSPTPFHGRSSLVYHDNSDLFKGIPSPFSVVRYHSLQVSSAPESEIATIAKTDSGMLMGIKHQRFPKWGVQFHPESVLTEHGIKIIANYRDIAHQHLNKPKIAVPKSYSTESDVERGRNEKSMVLATATLRCFSKALSENLNPEVVFTDLFADHEHCFWLDSQSSEGSMGRYSFMGCCEQSRVSEYRISSDDSKYQKGRAEMAELERKISSVEVEDLEQLPFEFRGGLVGYFSYEMKAIFGAKQAFSNNIPDSLWMNCDQFIAFEHNTGKAWTVAIVAPDKADKANEWLAETALRAENAKPKLLVSHSCALDELVIEMDKGYEGYIEAIKKSQEAIIDGETYEVCLTNHFSFKANFDAYQLYRFMRHGNAAPFGAFIKNGGTSILSTSPERFLQVNSDGGVQTKPIKGTCARSKDPEMDNYFAQMLAMSPKDKAENLMIVDLMRNDLARVSESGSVKVLKLMDIESYKTVHQMVSTVESRLSDGCSLFDLVAATFPGGSISGAPKIRTMEIIDSLEESARGVYCGSIGFLGYNKVADLNIGIRTLSYDGKEVSFGAGGAITYLSDPKSEFEEIILKAETLIGSLWRFFGGDTSEFKCEIKDKSLVVFDKHEKALAVISPADEVDSDADAYSKTA